MRKIYTTFLFACTLLFSSTLHAQMNWNEHSSTSQYTIQYSDPVNCSQLGGDIQAEYILLKVTNLTSASLQLSFRADLFYVGTGCITCNNPEYLIHLNIPANSSITTDCSNLEGENRRLAIFKKYTNRNNNREFDRFEITEIQVN